MERLSLQTIKDLITSDETAKKARQFSSALARASMLPVTLATPAAIVMNIADIGLASAQENCSIRVEFQSTRPEVRRVLEQNTSCRDSVTVSVDASKDHLIQMGPIQTSSIPDVTWPQAAVSIAGFALVGWGFYWIVRG